MSIKDILQGKPLGHPLHPMFVHFPIGLFLLSLLFDLSLLDDTGNTAVRGAFYTMLAGLAMAIVAAIPGVVDWADIRADHPAKRPATLHMWLNLALIALYALNVVTRLGALDGTTTPPASLILSIVGVGIVFISGYLGGKIVYDDGIGVGRHRRETPTPRDTIKIAESNGAKPGQYVAVADTAKMKEGETLRLDLNGNVMALVKWDGQFYAFQEFCTHRFGPLSEGSFADCQVRCPWHGSRFDLGTGKVTNGPAKLDIKVYHVRVQDGKVEIQVPTHAARAVHAAYSPTH